MVDFKIYRIIAAVRTARTSAKMLTLISWNNGPLQLDLRRWLLKGDDLQPCRGVTLTDDEAERFARAIIEYTEQKAAAQREAQRGE